MLYANAGLFSSGGPCGCSCAGLFILSRNLKTTKANAPITKTMSATPIPMPAFAPVLKLAPWTIGLVVEVEDEGPLVSEADALVDVEVVRLEVEVGRYVVDVPASLTT